MKKHTLKLKWKNRSFTSQMKFAFIAIFIFPFFLLFIFQSMYTKKIIDKKIISYMETNTRQAAMNISSKLTNYQNSAYQMILNNTFIENTLNLNSDVFSKYIYAKQNILESFQTLASYYSDIRSMALLTQDSDEIIWYNPFENDPDLYTTYTPLLEKAKKNSSHKKEKGLQALKQKNKWSNTTYFASWENRKYHQATLQHEILDFTDDYKIIGNYILNVKLDSFQEILENARTSLDDNNFLLIMDSNGQIFYALDDTFLDQTLKECTNLNISDLSEKQELFRRKLTSTNETVFLSTIPIANTNWYLINILKESYVNSEVRFTVIIMSLIALILFTITTLVISLISRSMSASIRSIVTSMKTACSGSLTVQVPEDTQNEISIIGKQFNLMMTTIQHQIQTLQTVNQQTKEAEIRSLEAQIDPHFLYNTLDSINWLAIENNEPEISSMLCNLASIMRYRIKDSNSLVSMDTELYYLEQYLQLQKMRFNNNFDYIIDMDSSLSNCKLHKLLFQPFIENALLHGFGELEHGGILKIIITRFNQNYLKFQIIDNGKGMTTEQLKNIFNETSSSHNSIGISNVLNRLKLYYENDYDFQVTSTVNKGTTISIVIPQNYSD